MARDFPWSSVEELVRILTMERDGLDQQIAALSASHDVSADHGRLMTLLCHYLVDGSAAKAVAWGNSIGWRVPGKTGPRLWQPKDIYDAIDQPPSGLPPPLVDLCRRVFDRNQNRNASWN